MSIRTSAMLYVLSYLIHMHCISKGMVRAEWILIHHSDFGSIVPKQIIYDFALPKTVPFLEGKSAFFTKHYNDILVCVTLKRECRCHERRSSRLKKTFAPSSTS